jgi:excisionase family DNA binding protein
MSRHAGLDHAIQAGMTTIPESPRLLTTKDVAKRLSLSPRSVERLRAQGLGPPFIRLGGAVRFDPRDVDAWLAAHRRPQLIRPR